MECPKCGFEQPESPTCARCGIVIAKFLERRLLSANPVEAVKFTARKLSAGLSGPWISFTPDIPKDDLWATLASYPPEEGVGHNGEEVLALIRDQDFDAMPGNHTLITSRRIIRSERRQGRITQLDLIGLRSVAVTGLRFEKLKLNDRELPLWAVSNLKEDERRAFLRVLNGIIRELRVDGPPGKFRVNRLTDYPSYMSTPGDGMVHADHAAKMAETFAPPVIEDEPPAPVRPLPPPVRPIELDDSDGEGDEAGPGMPPPADHQDYGSVPHLGEEPDEPLELAHDPSRHPLGTFTPSVSALAEDAPAFASPAASPASPAADPTEDEPVFYDWQSGNAPAPEQAAPPGAQPGVPPAADEPTVQVSPGGWLVGNVVGFLVGGIVGIPLGMLVGNLIHLPGRWPYYLGLIVGSMIWTSVANAIKYKIT